MVVLAVGAGGPTGGPFIRAALAAIEERTGWVAASAQQIVGTSAGAFVAAEFTEQAISSGDAIAALAALANGEHFQARPQTRLATVLRVAAGRLVAAVASMSKPLAEYTVSSGPYHPRASAVTVQHRSGQRVEHIFRLASDVQAVVRASSSIPGMDRPVEVDGVLHVDGAVHSANNADLLDASASLVVVISPMIPETGGSLVSRFHRAQLRVELDPFIRNGTPVVLVMPSAVAHADRRNREPFTAEGAAAVARLG